MKIKTASICATALCAAIVSCAATGGNQPRETGYFRSGGGDGKPANRAFAYILPDDMTDNQAIEFLEKRRRSPNKITVAVMYRPDAQEPGHRLTAAKDYFEAFDLLTKPPFDDWAFGVFIKPNGDIVPLRDLISK